MIRDGINGRDCNGVRLIVAENCLLDPIGCRRRSLETRAVSLESERGKKKEREREKEKKKEISDRSRNDVRDKSAAINLG